MKFKNLLVIGLVVFLGLSLLTPAWADSCKKEKSKLTVKREAYMQRFLDTFGHPLFLNREGTGLSVDYKTRKNEQVSAHYNLSKERYKQLEKEEEVDIWNCPVNILTIRIDQGSKSWCVEYGSPFKDIIRVDGYRFDNLPSKVQKKLKKIAKGAIKHLTRGMEKEVAAFFKVGKA